MRCTSAGLRGDAGWAGPVGGSGGRVDPRWEAQTWWSLADLSWATASGSLLVPERGRGGCYAAGRERAVRAGRMLGATRSSVIGTGLVRKELRSVENPGLLG